MAERSNWYVIRVAGGKEKKAKEYIEAELRAAGRTDEVSQILIPTEKTFSVKNGKKVSKESIFFPGYVLIEVVSNLTGELQHIIRNVPHVSGFLTEKVGKDGKDKQPTPLRESEIKRILGIFDDLLEQEEENLTPFVVGEAVKITDGPFNGFDGTIEEILQDKKKLKVMVKIFGRKTLLELNFVQVVKE
ncbi:MAG: transcription termination/antitermination factor NusG [Bacteroidales bacterium]|nr:transcription termination/antitermination factor NusG [Bacteroidales bacterium]